MKATLPMLLALLLFGSIAPAGADDWRKMRLAQFPAQVRSISFDRGHVIDRSRTLRWDAWTVGFGDRAPVANGLRMQRDGSLGAINIEKLKCSNRAVGESECTMSLWLPHTRANIPCWIGGDKTPTIEIDCPARIEFE